jgi:hypothetical protein
MSFLKANAVTCFLLVCGGVLSFENAQAELLKLPKT